MSTIIHDLRCIECNTVQKNAAMASGSIPKPCPLCQGITVICWLHGKPPATDVYGNERWNEGTGRMETSSRGAEKYMRSQGFDGHAGDAVGGARVEHKLVGTGFSYKGQGNRKSTGERAKA